MTVSKPASDVFFVHSYAHGGKSLITKLGTLLDRAGFAGFPDKAIVAVKVHAGDRGTTGYLRPIYARKTVKILKDAGFRPFVCDSTTLYSGARDNGVDMLETAAENGYSWAGVGAPVVSADGIRSSYSHEVEVGLRHYETVRIAGALADADALVNLSHFKAHMVTGIGGAIKNLAMGFGTRAMKQSMHASMFRPEIPEEERCTRCGDCVAVCPERAVILEGDGSVPVFDMQVCVSCGECIAHCTFKALKVNWTEKPAVLGEKMAETAYGALSCIGGNALHVNFLLDITPDCDCLSCSDDPMVPNIGILASRDPVALDQASADLVNAAPGLRGTRLKNAFAPGDDKFVDLRPKVDWRPQLAYAEEIGLGVRSYNLIALDDDDKPLTF